MVAADARTAITFSLSPGQAHDAPEGRKLLTRLGPQRPGLVGVDLVQRQHNRQVGRDILGVSRIYAGDSRADTWAFFQRASLSPVQYGLLRP